MNIESDRPLQLLREVARQHLPAVWVPGEDLAWVGNAKEKVRPARCFRDKGLSVPFDLSQPKARILFTAPVAPISVIAALAMDVTSTATILLRHDLVPLLAFETTTSEREGVVRLYDRPGLMILTPDDLINSSGSSLIRGAQGRSFRVEVRDDEVGWRPASVTIPVELLAPARP